MAKQKKLKNEISISIVRGQRLKALRLMAGLTREELASKYSVSASTLQSWEAAKAGGLTIKGANKMIDIFRQERIRCHLDWLLHGIGDPPQLSNQQFQVHEQEVNYTSTAEHDAILQELLTFRKLNGETLDIVVNDDGMSPHYKSGDVVAGKKRSGSSIQSLIGYDCIVITKQNESFLRKLKAGSKPDCYTLICINYDTDLTTPILYDQELIAVAPVIWHRRKDPN